MNLQTTDHTESTSCGVSRAQRRISAKDALPQFLSQQGGFAVERILCRDFVAVRTCSTVERS